MTNSKLVATQKKLELVPRVERFHFPQLISDDAASSNGTEWHQQVEELGTSCATEADGTLNDAIKAHEAE